VKNFYKVHIWASLAVAVAGFLTLFYPHFRRFHKLSSSLLPFNFARISHLLSISLGFLLLYFSIQLFRRKILAFWISVGGLAILLGLSILHGHHMVRMFVYIFVLGLLLSGRRTFSVKSDNLSVRKGFAMALVVFAVALIYGALGFYFLEEHDFNIDFTVLESLKYAFLQIITLQNSVLPPETESAEFFLQSLDVVGFLSTLLVVGSLFRPVRFALGASRNDRLRALAIITKYSNSVEDYFKLWPADKHYYFDSNNKAVLAYKVSAGVALIIDGPTGRTSASRKLLTDFGVFADEHGWIVAILHAEEKLQKVVTGNHFKRIFIGNEAMIRIDDFVNIHQSDKHFRYVQNKAKRENVSFEYWQAPLTSPQIEILKSISDEWVGRSGRREYTFIMGYFNSDYLRSCDVAVLVQAGNYVAYANVIPSYVSDARSVDQMRNKAQMPSIGMHYLLQQLIIRLDEQKIRWLNLGLSPLSGLEERLDSTTPEKLLKVIKSIGANYYSFKGLEQFKNKFKPDWQPRYIYYTGSPTNLLKIGTSLNRAVTIRTVRDRWKIFLNAAVVVAALSYVSFPLAYLVNRQNATGIISELGAAGQPFAWVFNLLDIVCGGIIIFLAVYAYTSYARLNIWRSRAVALFATGGIGGIGAALAPLPAINADTLNVHTLPHLMFSSLNFFGLLGAASIFVFILVNKQRRVWALSLYLALMVAGLLAVIFQGTIAGDIAQRVQICFVASWIIILGLAFTREH
jgi:phosphatidylglycerol lysyltransferase